MINAGALNTKREIKHEGHVFIFHNEADPSGNDYKMWAEVKGLPGCIIAGDSETEIFNEAKTLIPVFEQALKESVNDNPKSVTIKLRPQLYNLIMQYADDEGIESISTLIRAVLVKDMRKHGYNVPSSLAVSK